jgi:trehalose 6-phosphate synthase/phosphatase
MSEVQRIIVVSNRLPATLRRAGDSWKAESSAGGLATAMNPILKDSGGIWIGWSGDSSDPDDPARQDIIRRWVERERFIAVELPADIAELYYEGYANQTLWPLFHHFPTLIKFSPGAWAAYAEANERFRDVAVRNYRPGDLIWVHDYHLTLLPKLLRDALPEAAIGFFLHIPFPSSEVFRILPRREELLEGLLGADLLAFHTHSYVQHFRSTMLRVLGIESRFDRVEIAGRSVRLEALPIGIAPEIFLDSLKSAEGRKRAAGLKSRYGDNRILLAVDRLDYTKGIPERLKTFRRLLNQAPRLRSHVVLIQVAVPSREHVPEYARLSREVNELVGEINGQFGTPEWTPVVYLRRGLPRAQIAALYATADVGWVAPLRDGMNLVAKEYVACKTDGSGALVLSEFAGAAEEMGEAFLVNPYDEERTAETLEKVLSLPEDDRRERMMALRERVLRNNVYDWGEKFLSALREAALAADRQRLAYPRPVPVEKLVRAYRAARTRMLFLDYDGTLVGYAPRPEGAVPPPGLAGMLERLAADPGNYVVVVSGRRPQDLDNWMGSVPGLWLAAEHGALLRPPSFEWQPLRGALESGWKDRVRPVLEHFRQRVPGSLVEEKELSIAWHYRMADPEFAGWVANEMTALLEGALADTEFRASKGRKLVEVKPAWANKGAIIERILALASSPEFILAAGDDRTDEDMFTKLDDQAWTIHVGRGPSAARFALPDAASFRVILDQFTQNVHRA